MNRTNACHSVATGNISSASVVDSPSIHKFVDDGTKEPSSHLASSSVIRPQHVSLRSEAAAGQQADSTLFVTLLESLFENASSSAALKHEYSKIKAKATHQAKLDKRMGDLSKTFPAYAESSIKAKKDTDKDLALLSQKLAEHQKAQSDILSAVPDILQASKTSIKTEQMDMVRRCMSVYEVFKSNVEDLKQRFEKQESMALKREEGYQGIDNKIDSSLCQVRDLSSQVEDMRLRCSRLDDKHGELKNDFDSFRGTTTSSLAALKIDFKQMIEHEQQRIVATSTATDTINNLLQRLGVLESQYQAFFESDTIRAGKAERQEKVAENQSNELREIKATVLHCKSIGDAVKSINQKIEDLHQKLSAVQSEGKLSPPEGQDYSALETDMAALKADLLHLENDRTGLHDPGRLGQKLLPAGAVRTSPHTDDDTGNTSQGLQTALETRLERCVGDVENIQQRLKEQQIAEDERDDLIAAQVDEIRASTVKVREEFGLRIDSLERDVQEQRAEDLNRTQKLQSSFSQLLKASNQISTSRASPPSAPPTPGVHQMLQPQMTSSSPQPLNPFLPAELSRRVDTTESSLSATRQQLEAVKTAFQALDQRYTHLSTEPVVRAMVHQMQLMYPYASEAQQEIINLKRMVEPLKYIPVQLETLKRIADNDNARFAKLEARVNSLEEEKVKNETRQEKLVEHVKEERGKVVDDIMDQKETLAGLRDRLHCLEEYRKAEPDKLEYLTETLAKKWHTETMKTVEDITRRLDVLETDRSRQDLLATFAGKIPSNNTTNHVGKSDGDDTDDSSVPLVLKKDTLKHKAPPSSAPSRKGKALLKPKTASITKKRKRHGSSENYDPSDDETYTRTVHSSPLRRRVRG